MKCNVMIPDVIIRGFANEAVLLGISGFDGLQHMSGRETVAGLTTFLKKSSDTFIKEEIYLEKTGKKLRKIQEKWNDSNSSEHSRTILEKIAARLYSKNYTKLQESHTDELIKTLLTDTVISEKKYPTTVEILNNEVLNNRKLSKEMRLNKYDKFSKLYIDNIIKNVKKTLQQTMRLPF